MNGPAVQIDGNDWQGSDAKDYRCNGSSFVNTEVVLKPKTDSQREKMIRSSRWGSAIDVEITNLVPVDYRVFLYVWEDNATEHFQILVNDQVVIDRFASGTAGQWKRLGPWKANAKDGSIKISAKGGAANLSGVELWSHDGEIPNPFHVAFNKTPTEEQIAFFEAKIRPVLVEHCYECHSSEASEIGGGLLLDSHRGVAKGGDTSPSVVPR